MDINRELIRDSRVNRAFGVKNATPNPTKEDGMKLRLVAVVIGVVGLLGAGSAPAIAAPAECLPPIIYPFCG
jgi:hypothetical protein